MKLAVEIVFVSLLTILFFWQTSGSEKKVNARPAAVKREKSPQIRVLKKISEKQYVFELGLTEQERVAKRKISQALRKSISVNFYEIPLDEVAKNFSTQLEIPILLDEVAISDEGIATDEPITFRLNRVTAKNALDLILEKLDLTFIHENEVLLITSDTCAEEKLETRLYGFSDLELTLRYESPPVYQNGGQGYFNILDVAMSQVADPGNANADEEEYYYYDPLIDLLMNETSGPWEEIEGVGGTISAYRIGKVEVLVVRQTQRVHEEVNDLLVNLRQFHNTIVDARNAQLTEMVE